MIVLKFGGSSLSSSEKIKKRAEQIVQFQKEHKKVIVVVSAMGKTTDELNLLAKSVCENPPQRELDMLLTTGERISMSLLSMALYSLGCEAISFTGSQAGILTTQDHNDASIEEVRPIRVEEELNKGKVVIVAGFQGVDPKTKEVTTLGRGGSDTTAIAMAHHFSADQCFMLKDVEGIFDSDPNKNSDAKKFDQITLDEFESLGIKQSGVVHAKALNMAKKLNVSFKLGLADDPSKFTLINP